jgi:hypothetical protein
MEFPYNPEIPLLGIYLKKFKSSYNKDNCTIMFIAFAGKWVALENIILSEVRQVQKGKGCMFFHMGNTVLIQIKQ